MFLDKKLILTIFFGILIAEAISLFGHFWPAFNVVGFVLVVTLAAYLSWKKIELGLLVALAEIFVGSYGHLFVLGGMSIRMAIFIIVFLAWLFKMLINKKKLWPKNNIIYFYLLLAVFVLLGLIIGLSKNLSGNVYLDINAWAYFILILVFLSLDDVYAFLNQATNVLLGAASFLILQTLILFFTFSSGLNYLGDNIYVWFRDARIGEITYIGDNLFRIFIQSQIYLLIAILFFLTFLILNWSKLSQKVKFGLVVFLYFASLAIIISQSRSFWVGLVVALLALAIFLIWQKLIRFKILLLLIVILGIAIYSQLILLQLVSSSNILANRSNNLEKQSANISRINQLQPLFSNISTSPLIGHGFGKQLTYESQDPRVLEKYPDGLYTTFAFEWGYFDVALKIGLLGLLVYLLLIGKIFSNTIKQIEKRPEVIGLLAGLIALAVTNIFSPYLNHPLGITYILLISLI
ncbi:MAG: O-antigen ligase family protein [Candidatus Buchananbacteria bacterium]|nr:O-antigen ligase family protein [Candidatus Buchananbacteria bacterium]